jgi:polyisoprenoid-binding protein YceI
MSYRSAGLHADGEQFVLDGELTAHGITRPVPLRVEVNGFGKDPTATSGAASPRPGHSTAVTS